MYLHPSRESVFSIRNVDQLCEKRTRGARKQQKSNNGCLGLLDPRPNQENPPWDKWRTDWIELLREFIRIKLFS